jgi:hypothetical protein
VTETGPRYKAVTCVRNFEEEYDGYPALQIIAGCGLALRFRNGGGNIIAYELTSGSRVGSTLIEPRILWRGAGVSRGNRCAIPVVSAER